MEAGEKDTFHNLKWWSLEELRKTEEEFEPKDQILNVLERLHPLRRVYAGSWTAQAFHTSKRRDSA